MQLKPVAGTRKLVSSEGFGLACVDPRFPSSPDSGSGRCRGHTRLQLELKTKQKNRKRLNTDFIQSGSEQAGELGQVWAGDDVVALVSASG